MQSQSLRAGRIRALQRGILFFLMASSFIAFIEPSPFEFGFLILIVVFVATNGLRLSSTAIPLAVCLFFFVIGGIISLFPYLTEQKSVMFTGISAYLAVATMVFAMILRTDAEKRLEALRDGYILAAIAASIAGILGYFNVLGLGSIFTGDEGRAAGSFKDPNVLGTFVILPLIYLARSVLVERLTLARVVAIGIILFGGTFLSFSRGAWVCTAASLAAMVIIEWSINPSKRIKRRIVTIAIAGLAILIPALLVALSFDVINDMFQQRAVILQDYDSGANGRFGKLLIAIPELLELPNGYGPLRFRFHSTEDAHDVYVNAFASYGWLGGFSYVALMVLTVAIGYRVMRTQFPLRHHAIIIGSTLFFQILQGFQIDTDHWRHFWLMLGLLWGMVPAAREAERLQATKRTFVTHPPVTGITSASA